MRNMSKESLIGWLIIIAAIGVALELLFTWGYSFLFCLECISFIRTKVKTEKESKCMVFIGLLLIFIAIASTGFFVLR
ncbi:hypothetical protein ACI2OX_14105 [Bacillus sp. N9]